MLQTDFLTSRRREPGEDPGLPPPDPDPDPEPVPPVPQPDVPEIGPDVNPLPEPGGRSRIFAHGGNPPPYAR